MLKLNFDYTTIMTLPSRLRNAVRRISWLNVMVKGLKNLINKFDDEYYEYVFSASHNNQILSLENFLNTKIIGKDYEIISNDLIYISDRQYVEDSFILYLRDETFTSLSSDLYLRSETTVDEPIIYSRSESVVNDITADYIINVPISYSSDDNINAIESYMKDFNPAGKTYEIYIYN